MIFGHFRGPTRVVQTPPRTPHRGGQIGLKPYKKVWEHLPRPDYDYLGLGSKMCTIQWLNLTKTIYALKWSKLIRKSNFGYEIYVKFSKFLRGWVHFFKKLDIFTENRDFSTMWPKKSRKKLIFSLKIDFFQKIANFLKKPTPPRENIENFTQFS